MGFLWNAWRRLSKTGTLRLWKHPLKTNLKKNRSKKIDLENDKFKKEVLNELDESFLSSPPQLFKNAKKVLRLLKNNYLICLTSNTGITSPKTYRKYLNNLGIIDIFDKVYLSNELLVAKPSSLVFKKITNDFKFKADQIVHVGDNIFTDIFGAKKISHVKTAINSKNFL